MAGRRTEKVVLRIANYLRMAIDYCLDCKSNNIIADSQIPICQAVLEEGYAARGEICANRSTLVQVLADISSRRRYREYSVPRGLLCGGGMRTPRFALRTRVRPL